VAHARKLFFAAGFEPIASNVLKKIYTFSFRVMNSQGSSALKLVCRCLAWRNNHWWKNREGEGGVRRAHPGRPHDRWEDVFCAYKSMAWHTLACTDKEGWKKDLENFVKFAWDTADSKFKVKNREDRNLIKRMLKKSEELNQAPKVDQDIALFPWDDSHNNGIGVRLELLGDSLCIVNWTNAVWPIQKFEQQKIVSRAQKLLWQWHRDFGVLPRRDCENWARHVPRELNDKCDSLAHQADSMQQCDLVVNFFSYDIKSKFIVAKWDGGYIEGQDTVTIGFSIDVVVVDEEIDNKQGRTAYQLVSGYGRCPGNSAIKAELSAFDSLLHVIGFLLDKSRKHQSWLSQPLAFSEGLWS